MEPWDAEVVLTLVEPSSWVEVVGVWVEVVLSCPEEAAHA